MFILERKTRYVWDTDDFVRGTDRAVQLKDEYRTVMRFAPADIRFVKGSLESYDIQRKGGAKLVAERMKQSDERERELLDRRHRDEMEAVSSEAYDYLAWREGRRVAV